jgi:hypothetical protein
VAESNLARSCCRVFLISSSILAILSEYIFLPVPHGVCTLLMFTWPDLPVQGIRNLPNNVGPKKRNLMTSSVVMRRSGLKNFVWKILS